jgi:hypothetical protein
MVVNHNSGVAFKRRKLRRADEARDRHKFSTLRAQQVIVMRVDQLKASTPVFDDQFADFAFAHQLFSRAKNRRKVCMHIGFGQSGAEILECPRVMLARFHQREQSG